MGLINIDVGTLAGKIIDAVSTHIARPEDKQKMAELEAQINTMLVTTQAEIDKAQAAINLEDSKSSSFFKSGWRPSCAWLCIFGLAWQTIIKSSIEWASIVLHKPVVLPNIETSILVTLLMGMLGLATMRTVERINNKI